MKTFWRFILPVLCLLSCNTDRRHQRPTDFIPENSSTIVAINNVETLKGDLTNSDLLNSISSSSIYVELSKKLMLIDKLQTNDQLLLCFNKDGDDSLQSTVITRYKADLFPTDSLPDVQSEVLKREPFQIFKTQGLGSVIYNTVVDSIFIASSSLTVLEKAISKNSNSEYLNVLLNTANDEKSASVLTDHKKSDGINSIFLNDSIALNSLSSYTLLDLDIDQNAMILNGISKSADSIPKLIDVFKNTIPQENLMANVIPSNADGFMSLSFDDFSIFKDNLNSFNQNDVTLTESTLFDNIIEVGLLYEGQNRAILLRSLDVIATQDALLNDQNIEEVYRQVSIYRFSEPDLFRRNFYPFILFESADYYAIIDDYFVFTNSLETLENIIANYQNKTTFSSRSYYKDVQQDLTDESSLLMVVNGSSLEGILQNNFSEHLDLDLQNYKTSALQLIYDTHFAHMNVVVRKSKSRVRENAVVERYNIKLEHDLLTNPQLVTNHISKHKEIVIQDVNNNLYLISNTGKVLWKKRLPGPILGQIEQVDMYKNGRLQLAFATKNRVFILDRNGNDVAPFPLKFNDDITQPLSVFDYDKNKNYRLLVTQGKDVLMYDIKGKIVKGFTFKSAENEINHQPQHIRIGSKDYIIIKTTPKLHILNRVGKTRVTPKGDHRFSDQAVYLHKGKFTTTTENGTLIDFNTTGADSSQNIGLESEHEIVMSSRTLVAQNNNKLSIKGKTLELDFGNYERPQFFYINDKIYISVNDLQTQKIYLFDSNADLIDNFPVYGNSPIALDNIDKDSNLEFVTKGDDNSIIIYEINR